MSRLDDLLHTPSDTRPLPAALPLSEDPPGATEAVLLLHGFTGIPRELSGVSAALASEGYAVRCPRYPGHGTSRRDMLNTRAEDWARRAFDAYMELRSVYPVVHVGGHSMGGLLACAVAAAFEAPRLMLLAPAFEVKGTVLAPLFAPFAPVVPRRRPPTELDRADPARAALHGEYWADDLVAPAAQLRRLIRSGRRRLRDVRSRILVLAGDADATVPVSSLGFVRRTALNAAELDIRVLEGAGHLFPFDRDAGRAIAMVSEWMRRP